MTRRVRFTSVVIVLCAIVCTAVTYAQQPSRSIIVRTRPGVDGKLFRERVAALVRGDGISTAIAAASTAVRVVDDPSGVLGDDPLARYWIVTGADSRLLDRFKSDDLVETAFENHRYRLDHTEDAATSSSSYDSQWALRAIDLAGAWELTRGAPDVLVGIVDTGIELDHPELADALWVNPAEDINGSGKFEPWPSTEVRDGVSGDIDGIDQDGNGLADDVVGYDFVDQVVPNVGDWAGRDPIPSDEQGHGTSVAGVIAAADDGVGVTGVAPGVRLVVLRAFDATGNGEDDDIAAAIVHAAEVGVKVLNLSFGDAYNSPLLHDAIRYASERGVLVVASSGNDGNAAPHYPANFPEVMSVGAVDSLGQLSAFSSYGSQLSLVAPGRDIATTDLDGGYRLISGTSFSAPHVAGVAALIRSIHPDWSPQEVRGAIELSAADDPYRPGWDTLRGAGMLDAAAAVRSLARARIAIDEPDIDATISTDTTVAVIGSARSPFLSSWQLSIGTGNTPTNWTDLTSAQSQGRLRDTLGMLTTDGLSDGTYTVRLHVDQTDGHSTERRTRLYVDRSPPRILRYSIDTVWRFAARAVALSITTDDVTRVAAWVRMSGTTQPWLHVEFEPVRSGLLREHYIYLSEHDLAPDVPYDLYLVASNTAGDTSMVGSPEHPLSITRSGEGIPLRTFESRSYQLPYGFADGHPAVVGGRPVVLLNRFERGNFGPLFTYEFQDSAFRPRDSVDALWIPRGVGDVDGDGLREVLVQSFGTSALYSQTTSGGSLLAVRRWIDTSGNVWASRLADLDGDGHDEVIYRTDNFDPTASDANGQPRPSEYRVADLLDGRLETIAELPNPTEPAAGQSRNTFGPPKTVVADFDGDGRQEILFGDDDADFMIYERADDGRYQLVWTDTNEGEGGSEIVGAADVDGDGRPEIVVGYHSSTIPDAEGNLDPPMWTVKVLRREDDGRVRVLWRERFAYVRPSSPFRSGLTVGDFDGRPGDELVLTLFPSLYVFRWNPLEGTLVPYWQLGGDSPPAEPEVRNTIVEPFSWFGQAIDSEPIVADLDGDGRPELGVGNGSQIRFFSPASDSTRPDAPTGLRGWAVDDRSVRLRWNSADGADRYVVFRGPFTPDGGVVSLDSIATTTSSTLLDTGLATTTGHLENNTVYAYSVASLSDGPPGALSELPALVVALTHPAGRFVAADAVDSRRIEVAVDVPLPDAPIRTGAVVARDSSGRQIQVSTVVWTSATALLITLEADHGVESITLQPSILLRDYFHTPFDTTAAVTLTMPSVEPVGECFAATRSDFGAERTLTIEFNRSLDPASLADATFLFDPTGGTIDSVWIDPSDGARLLLRVAPGYPIGAVGRAVSITLGGIRSSGGAAIEQCGGNVVGVAIAAPDLSGVFVYPQPFAITRDVNVTIAGLPLDAVVTIHTQTGSAVRTLDAVDGTGGVRWDGRDDSGKPVATGIYLYRVSIGDEHRMGKIAVVR